MRDRGSECVGATLSVLSYEAGREVLGGQAGRSSARDPPCVSNHMCAKCKLCVNLSNPGHITIHHIVTVTIIITIGLCCDPPPPPPHTQPPRPCPPPHHQPMIIDIITCNHHHHHTIIIASTTVIIHGLLPSHPPYHHPPRWLRRLHCTPSQDAQQSGGQTVRSPAGWRTR